MEQTTSPEQQVLTEESLRKLLIENNNKVYRKGYNDACVVISTALKTHTEGRQDLVSDIIKNVSDIILKCKLEEE